MKVIYIESIEDDEVGEVEGAFTEDGSLLHIWCSNDATWRHEYFHGLMTALGIEVRYGLYEDKLVECAKKWL